MFAHRGTQDEQVPASMRMERTAELVNERNEAFWKEIQRTYIRRISETPCEFKWAFEALQAEGARYPVYCRRPLEQILIDDESTKKRHHEEFSRRGGKATKPDALGKVIDGIVQGHPTISCPELLSVLRTREKIPPILEIDDEYICLSNGKSVAISGLKDRLSRAKKKYKLR